MTLNLAKPLASGLTSTTSGQGENLLSDTQKDLTTWGLSDADRDTGLGTDSQGNLVIRLKDDGGATGQVNCFTNTGITFSSAGNYRFSIVGRSDQLGFLALIPAGIGLTNAFGHFDLGSGSLGTIEADLTSGLIEDLGGGEYKCSVDFPVTSDLVGNLRIYIAEGANDHVVDDDGTSSIFISSPEITQI